MRRSIFKLHSDKDLELKNLIRKDRIRFIDSLPQVLSLKDVIEIMPIGKTKIYELIRRGRMPGNKIDGQWIIPKTLFLQWLYFGEFEAKNIIKRIS